MTREEAIKYGNDYYRDLIAACCEISKKHKEFVRMSLEALEKEPRKGKWYRQTNDYVDYYECSECGMAMGIYDVKNYCPNCGSRNEVEE